MTVVNLEEAISASKKIIDDKDFIFNLSSFSKYTPCYFFTTECIKTYLDDARYQVGSVLSVIGSGDQIFNLLTKGFLDIDAFDINLLTYYNYYLKQAFIMSLSYEEFNKLNRNGWYLSRLTVFKELLEKIKGNMPKDVYEYYKEIVEYCERINPFCFPAFVNGEQSSYDSNSNGYANDEDTYRKLQKMIEQARINLYFDDASNIPNRVKGNYDLILLSNISDYLGKDKLLTKEEFDRYIASFYSLLNVRGLIINYLYRVGPCGPLIESSNIHLRDLGEENVFKIPGTTEGYYRVRKIK